MPNKQNFLPFFLVFFGLSLLLILLGTTGIFKNIESIFNRSMEPAKGVAYVLTLNSLQEKAIKTLTAENLKLKKELSGEKSVLEENVALKSQFESSMDKSPDLLPAKVIGSPGFVPGVSIPGYLIINKGKNAGVKNGDAVLSNNYLVGKIVTTYSDLSKVELITNNNSSFTAKVLSETDSNGIIKGQGGDEMILDNVLLTTTLKKDAEVLTKGDKNEKGEGYPPDINIGKISSIEKKQSDLFQRASIVSPIDFNNLNIVFIMK